MKIRKGNIAILNFLKVKKIDIKNIKIKNSIVGIRFPDNNVPRKHIVNIRKDEISILLLLFLKNQGIEKNPKTENF
tara:strand:- start:1 stop:228 length:228 start_codon:yes stop_codon:yes gene_type:complete